MKNVYYLFLVLIGLLCSLSTSAKKVLYSQNFETATSVAETGWTSPSAAAGLSIGSDESAGSDKSAGSKKRSRAEDKSQKSRTEDDGKKDDSQEIPADESP